MNLKRHSGQRAQPRPRRGVRRRRRLMLVLPLACLLAAPQHALAADFGQGAAAAVDAGPGTTAAELESGASGHAGNVPGARGASAALAGATVAGGGVG